MKKQPITILLCNLGTPSEPSAKGVRAFLKPFLSDRRVVEVPRLLWLMILYCFILPFRPKPVAKGYQQLWDEYGDSPLRLISISQVKLLQALYNSDEVQVDYAFTYGEPSIATQLERYGKTSRKVVVLPLYPQYSCSTTAAIYDQVAAFNARQRNIVDVNIIKHYYQYAAYEKALATSLEKFWAEHGRGDYLLMSYHGVPQAYADKGDPYYQQCLDTSKALVANLQLKEGSYGTSFQSRLGKAPWLQPYTDVTVKQLAKDGVKVLDVICPAFSVDCLETLEEISVENGDYFTEAGGVKLRLVPCLNDAAEHIQMMHEIIQPLLQDAV